MATCSLAPASRWATTAAAHGAALFSPLAPAPACRWASTATATHTHEHERSLSSLFARRSKGSYHGPLAVAPPPAASSFEWLRGPGAPLNDARAVQFQCLSRAYTITLVERLEQLSPACAALRRCGGADALALDGEFDAVCAPTRHASGRRRYSQRMALLTLLAPASPDLFAFHLPSLFGAFEDGADQRYRVCGAAHAGVADLFALLASSQLVTWCGTSSDLPALRFALPSIAVPRHYDLQWEVARGAKSGLFPPDAPLGLHGAALKQFGVGLDKSYQLAQWGALPSPSMLAYAGADVTVTLELYTRFRAEGTLFQGAGAGEKASQGGGPGPGQGQIDNAIYKKMG